MSDTKYMQLALELAGLGAGAVSPNPMVGAVIVRDGQIIGRGYHKEYGSPHAERNALADCVANGHSAKGATLYVTLEPCCHTGKTPPCTSAVIESGISKVVVGTQDPNLLVAGKGVEILRSCGIEVVVGVLEDECIKQNSVFFHYIKTKTPYVIMKYAMTADGKIATHSGKSKWITGELARNRVHQDRARYAAIMVGVGTVLADDPLLTCRIEGGRNPVRVVCDTHLRTPNGSQIVKTAKEVKTIIATSCTNAEKIQAYTDMGCQVLRIPKEGSHINLQALFQALGEQKIDSVLLEGGATLNWSVLKGDFVQKIQAYIAPKIFGGNAKTPVAGEGVDAPPEAFFFSNTTVTMLGDDILVESEA